MRLFGTDGIRGITEKDLTAELANKVGCVAGSLFCKDGGKVIIGRDTRGSGVWLEDALIEGLVCQGANIIKAGVVPTPAISYLTRKLKAKIGIVISASHNPDEYNGIKFFDHRGIKLEKKLETEIEKQLKLNVKFSFAKGKIENADARNIYTNYLKSIVKVPIDGIKVFLDCANGAASYIAPEILNEVGADIYTRGCNPNGRNINLECGSTYPQNLQKRIKAENADIGLAFDGDADRAIAVDEKGGLVDGDFIMAICAKQMKKKNVLKENKVVTTVMTNLGFHLAMKKIGIEVPVTKVGDKYVLEEMLKQNVSLGGEQSGHIIYKDHSVAGDGIITALELLQIMQETQKPLSELKNVMERLPQVLINISVKDKRGFDKNKKMKNAIKFAQEMLGENGRILVRPSGTEELIRVMTESDSIKNARDIAENLADVVKGEFS